jgi:iron uptake system component EfeO
MITTRLSRRARLFSLPLRSLILTSTCALVSLPLLAGCTDNAPAGTGTTAGGNPRALTVQATDSECKLSTTSAPSGTVTFAVTNGGSKVTEFYLYGEDGKRTRHYQGTCAEGRARKLHHRLQAGDGRRWNPRPVLSLRFWG